MIKLRLFVLLWHIYLNKGGRNMNFVRGDSFPFKVLLSFADKKPIKKSDISTLFVTCRQYANTNFPILFQKELDDVEIDKDGYCHIVFEPADTEGLDYGKYFFDIEITLNSGYRKSKLYEFELTKETTIHETGVQDGN